MKRPNCEFTNGPKKKTQKEFHVGKTNVYIIISVVSNENSRLLSGLQILVF